jgi:hypothetical protein
MAINTTAGSEFRISAGVPASLDATGYGALTYTLVGECTDMGEVGREYNIVNHNPISDRKTKKLKGSYNPGDITLQYARDYSDAGQILLKAASESDATYTIKIITQSGKFLYFRALVTSFKTNMGGVDQVLGGTAVLTLQENVLEV